MSCVCKENVAKNIIIPHNPNRNTMSIPIKRVLKSLIEHANEVGRVKGTYQELKNWIGPEANKWDVHGIIIALKDEGYLRTISHMEGEYFQVDLKTGLIEQETEQKEEAIHDPKKVFIVHGRNKAAYNAMVQFLRSLKLEPLDFDELSAKCGGSPFIGEVVHSGINEAKAVVVIFTPDEEALLLKPFYYKDDKPEDRQRWQARPKISELG